MNPLALEPEAMRAMGHRTVDLLVELLAQAERPPLCRASPEQMAERMPFGASEEPQDFEALLAHLQRDVLPFMSNSAHPGYMAFVPNCGTFPGCARRLPCRCAQRLRRLLDGGPGAEPRRARRPRLVQGVDRLPERGRRGTRDRRLGGQPHRARVRARDPARADGPARGAIRLRSGSRFGRARRTRARVQARSGPRPCRPTPINASSRRPWRRRSAPTPTPADGLWRSWPPRAPPIPERSTRCAASPVSAANTASGFTSTQPTAASPR